MQCSVQRSALPSNKNKIIKFLKNNIGIIYILPWLVGFLVFKLYPFCSSLVYSFTDFNLFKGINEVGAMNYVKIFSNKKIVSALLGTVKYVLITVPLKLVIALFIAYILNFKIRGVNFFRTAYYIPSILGGSVAIAVLWKAMFRDEGIVNTLLGYLNIQGPTWLSDPNYAIWIICLLRVWQFGSAMVLFLAALKGVPEDLYEASTIDGAGKWQQFLNITIPMITPVIFYNLITQMCTAFQEFNAPYIITNGGPRGSTTLIAMLVYNYGFKMNEMGMASALAWVMFIVVAILTIVSFISQKYWVYYSDEEN